MCAILVEDIVNAVEYKDGKLYRKYNSSQVKVGDEAGCMHSHGYKAFRVKNKLIYCHRAVWIIHNGDIPKGMQIDHINGDRSDNRIENLRLVSHMENHKNLKRYVRRKPGVTGVNMDVRGKWSARISIDGKIVCLGTFIDFICACEARIVAEVNAKYHKNSGMR
ncbi:TPA: HNH endonuclease [Escherichia coli]|nr:HNH endonuclease [Escherichia coli]